MGGTSDSERPAPRNYAIIGWPVAHSVSPAMQEAGFAALGLTATYERIAAPPDQLGAAMARLRAQGYAGWNVTVPHKEEAAAFLDVVAPDARAAGSVNTVLNRDGRLHGFSTDGYGLATAIHESFTVPVPGRTFAFIGTGGAARATAVYLARQGARALTLINRTLRRAEALASTIHGAAPECRVTCLDLQDHAAVAAHLAAADVIVQATSLGLQAGDPLPVPADVLPPGAAVMDMVYGNTPFLEAARALGCRVADGRGMLLHQGALSLEIWTGAAAPVAVMRAALDAALAARAR